MRQYKHSQRTLKSEKTQSWVQSRQITRSLRHNQDKMSYTYNQDTWHTADMIKTNDKNSDIIKTNDKKLDIIM